jgi:uncharacterized protein (TIGR00297 family)
LTIALAGRRAGSLSTSGAIAATVVGALAVTAGWGWGALLVAYFVGSSALSSLGDAVKRRRTSGIVEKVGPRDAIQVIANGGIYACCAVFSQLSGLGSSMLLAAAALGAIAAATADTWATEIGTLVGGEPRSVLSWRRVPPGTSGGVTLAGSLAMVAGAAFIALLARWLELGPGIVAILSGGVAGAVVDSLLGASVQARRWCETCQRHTEQHVHTCGHPTSLASGHEWLDNDLVNLLCTVAGAAVAALVASL